MKAKDLQGEKFNLDKEYEIKHLFIRGNYRQDIFFDKIDFINAWNRIWLSAYLCGIEILAVEILSNHIHICIRYKVIPGIKRLSNFVHHLRMSLSCYFNRRYDVHGSLGSRRYGSANVIDIEVDGGEDLKDLIRYIIRNVTHHGITEVYQKWPYSTYSLVFHLFPEGKCLRGENIPKKLVQAYIPSNRKIPEEFAMTADGMLIPSTKVFPRKMIENLFGCLQEYIKDCNTQTNREKMRDVETNERKLGYPINSRQRIDDNIIIDHIGKTHTIPIISMSKEQCIQAIKDVREKYPRISLRQLSRVFHIPMTTIHYWITK